jgi:hypothetical protein
VKSAKRWMPASKDIAGSAPWRRSHPQPSDTDDARREQVGALPKVRRQMPRDWISMTVGRSLWEPPILVQRQWSVLDDTLHNEGGAEALDAWEGGEVVVLDLLEGGQVGGDDAQKVVGLTEEPLGLPDVGMAATACSNASTVARSPPRMMGGVRNPV